MMMRVLSVLLLCAGSTSAKPNIVYILCDDLGYGDVHCLNSEGKIATPNMDRLAKSGITFTDAHSSSAVCSPTRYGVLTGRYNWRSPLKNGVLNGYSPRLIEEGRLTVPAFLKTQGYTTACIGKWHLGIDMPLKEGGIAKDYGDQWKVDYTKPLKNGPLAVGFDSYFGISASLDMPPYVWIENDRFTKVPTVDKTWIRKGPAADDFEAVDVLPTLTAKAVTYISDRAADAKKGKPFFLYLPLTSPHTPLVPSKEWQGKSGLNDYADFVMQTDDTVGQVLDAIRKAGIAGDTLVIMTSDNGCSPKADFPELLKKGHNPSYKSRGLKADIFDGGHHVPFLAACPAKIKPGSVCDQTICLTDLFATVAAMLDQKLPDTAAEDSVSMLPAFEGKVDQALRDTIVHHSINGSFAIRQGPWKLALCPDSGGWSAPLPGKNKLNLPAVQLYDLKNDVGEKNNVADAQTERVERLTQLLEKQVAEGRSTPGGKQKNTGDVRIRPGQKR